MTERAEPFVHTASGLAFPFMNPRADLVRADDISRGLAGIVRYCGKHVANESVAVHSIIVADLLDREAVRVEPALPLAALLHDAAEIYIGDMPSPVKARFPLFSVMEDAIMEKVREAFGLPAGIFHHPALKVADHLSMLQEVGAQVRGLELAEETASDDDTADAIRSQYEGIRPEHYGFKPGFEWPEREELHPLLVDLDASNYTRAEMLWVLRFEAEVRRIAEKRPSVAAACERLTADAKTRSVFWRPMEAGREVFLNFGHAPYPAFLRDVGRKMCEWNALVSVGRLTPEQAEVTGEALGLALAERGATFAELAGERPKPEEYDQELGREDPARAAVEYVETMRRKMRAEARSRSH